MKYIIPFLFFLTSFVSFAQSPNTEMEKLAQQQLEGYNKRDIDLFLEPYSDSVEVYNFPNQMTMKGKEEMRVAYSGLFKNAPNLHCKLVSRMVHGNQVIDQELVTGFSNGMSIRAVAIYVIEDGKIAKVYFLKSIADKPKE